MIVAEYEALRRVVKKGKAVVAPGLAHSVHVEVNGLKPQRPYWYRFKAGAEVSPVGRASTAPVPGDANSRLKFAFASCQNWENGLWTAYDHMRADDPDLVVHLEDYIYEGPAHATAVRPHNSAEIVSLSDYRNRHALYETDPAIQKMHTHCPWILTWDDHEVDNNYANDIPEDNQPREEFMERRANAYQADYEHIPLRIGSLPQGSKMQMRVPFGRLVEFAVLDTRQYRTDQPCGDGTKEPCAGVYDPQATIMGDEQVCRDRLMRFLADRKPSNPIVVTGDIHSNWVSDLKVDWKSEHSAVAGTEFTGTSISSGLGGHPKPAIEGHFKTGQR